MRYATSSKNFSYPGGSWHAHQRRLGRQRHREVLTVFARSSDGLQDVTIAGPTSGAPACATLGYFIIKDEKSDAGKAQFSMLLSAKLSSQVVSIVGAGTCSRWSDGEDIETVVIQP